jgi:hypothetical protein
LLIYFSSISGNAPFSFLKSCANTLSSSSASTFSSSADPNIPSFAQKQTLLIACFEQLHSSFGIGKQKFKKE